MFSGELLDYDEDPLQLEPKKRKRSNNEVTIYPCDKWLYAATTACDLRRHIKINYEGMRNLSDKREYTATTPSSLKQHIESKYEGVRFPCDKCEYTANTANSLKRHLIINMKE